MQNVKNNKNIASYPIPFMTVFLRVILKFEHLCVTSRIHFQ